MATGEAKTNGSGTLDGGDGNSAAPRAPRNVVDRFLRALAAGDRDAAVGLMDESIVYTNVGVSTLRGRKKAARVVDLLNRPGMGFGVHTFTSATDGDAVLTERVDEIAIGPVRMRFWVCGKFIVVDGGITLWRDYFDFFDCTKAFLRALAGAVAPSLNRPMPG